MQPLASSIPTTPRTDPLQAVCKRWAAPDQELGPELQNAADGRYPNPQSKQCNGCSPPSLLSLIHRLERPMTDPNTPEAQSEELDLEQLEEAAGGILAQANQQPQVALSLKRQENKFMTNTFARGETRAYNPEVDKDRD